MKKILMIAAVMTAGTLNAAAQSGEMSADRRTACQRLASQAVSCCVHVTGDVIGCRGYGRSGEDASRRAVQTIVGRIVRMLSVGGTALSRMTAAQLIPQLVTDRLDLTGQERLASGQIARCMQGEFVPDRWNRMGSPFDNTPARAAAYIEREREACRQENVEAAIREVQRPRASGEYCGRVVTEQPPMQLTGHRPPAMSYVQPAHYCSAGAPNCCPGRGLYSGSAYCNAGTPSPLCLPNRAP